MNPLGELTKPKGATRVRRRVGRGESSGRGKTSGRGVKGAKSRTGFKHRYGFEGGQMPLIRRIPKRGFNHTQPIPIEIVNIQSLNRFDAGSTVDAGQLAASGLIRKAESRIKVLGDGELKVTLTVKAHCFSSNAVKKISAAGGKTEKI